MRLLMDQSFSHSCSVTFLEAPWLRMNSFSASNCKPLLNTPCTEASAQSALHACVPCCSVPIHAAPAIPQIWQKHDSLYVKSLSLTGQSKGKTNNLRGRVASQVRQWNSQCRFWKLSSHPKSKLTLNARRELTCTEGMRGSSQPSTFLVSTNQVSLRLESTVLTRDSRE